MKCLKNKKTGNIIRVSDVQETSQEYMIITDGQISFNNVPKK